MRTPLLIVLAAATVAGCAVKRRTDASPELLKSLWVEPKDIERRDLFYGAGGKDFEPSPSAKFKILDTKKTGTQPGYEVEEVGTGREWSVKLGVEARTEVTVSRIVWAVGYYEPPSYYMPKWTSVDKDGKEVMQGAARFRLESKNVKKNGDWSWRNNPFSGSRELAGLFTLMIMVNNWDIKRDQNSVYEVAQSDGDTMEQYVVRDLGAAFGKSKWLSFGSKDDAVGFDQEPFVVGVRDNRAYFGYQGSWLVPQMVGSIAPSDVEWICGWLAKLSDQSWHDAFRAGGFTDSEADRYINRLKQKVEEGKHLAR